MKEKAMRHAIFGAISFTLLLAWSGTAWSQAEQGQRALAPITPVLQKYCVGCHSGEKPKGDLALDGLSADFGANGAAWNKVLERLTDRTMPPKGKPQPSDAERKSVTDWISGGLTAYQQDRAHTQGRALLRRLNRIEYENTINDLLGTDIRLLARLPQDGSAFGFDTVDVALDMAGPILERYIEAADVALDAALAHGPQPAALKTRFEINESTKNLTSKGRPLERQLFSFRCLIESDRVVYFFSDVGTPPETWRVFQSGRVPVAGRYTYRIQASSYQDPDRLVSYLVYAGELRRGATEGRYVGVFDVTEEPSVAEFTVYQNAGETIRIIPYGVTDQPRNFNLKKPEEYPGSGLGVHWMEVEGPISPWPPVSYTRLLGEMSLDNGSLADAEMIVRRLLPKAFRRPVTVDEVKLYVALVESKLKQGGTFEQALRIGLKAVLCSPDFLYLKTSPGWLSDYELACRLSYFLWSTMPDDVLLELAAKGELGKSETLHAQVERMLNDPRAHAFTENFTGQWLNTRDVFATTPEMSLYRDYDDLLGQSMVRETQLFFEEMLKGDRSLLEFVHCDWSILNERLAKHYGIAGVKGQSFRKVVLPPDSHRGGVLTQASVLKVTANGLATSPVQRGAFVLDRILGTPPPPPPNDVEAIEPDVRGATTIREQLAKHRQNAACAACHAKIDPPGFALESFDVIGHWRDRYRIYAGDRTGMGNGLRQTKDGSMVECADELAGKGPFRNIDEFKQLLLQDKDQIARNLTEQLFVFATGHKMEFADRDALEKIVAALPSKHYGFRALIHEVVQSDLFRNK